MLQMLWNFVIGTPSVALIILIVVFIATVKGTTWVNGVNARLNVLGDKSGKGGIIDEIRNELKEIRKEREQDRKDREEFKSEVKAEFSDFSNRFTAIETTLKSPSNVQTSSPLVLSDSGKKVAKAIDADDLAQRYAHTVKLPEDPEEITAFNIQEACLEYARRDLLTVMAREDRQRVQQHAFETGAIMFHVNTVLGIKLRDVILKERGLFPETLKG